MATYNFTPVTGGVTVIENGGQAYTRPLGYDTLADGGNSVMLEQRPASGGVWGRRIYLTDSLTVSGNLFSGTSAQMLTLLQTTFAASSGNATSTDATLSTSDIPTNNVSTTKHGFAPKAPNVATQFLNGLGAWSTPTGASVNLPSDYTIIKSGPTYFSFNSVGATAFSGADFYTVAQATINALRTPTTRGGGGGHILFGTGTFTLSDELLISGWENQGLTNPGYSQIIISGQGKSTYIYQNTAGKNGIVIKNNASVSLKDIRVECSSLARTALRLDPTGTDEISCFGGKFDNLYLTSSSATYPALYMANFFDCVFGTITCQNNTGNAIHLENVSTTTLYGNSHFEFVRAIASPSAGFAGLKVSSTTGSDFRVLDLITFSNYECVSGYYGVNIIDGINLTFGMVDIEYGIIGFHIGGGSYARYNYVLSGVINVSDTAGKCIECTTGAGGNSFTCSVGGPLTSIPISDTQQFLPPNYYDIVLGADNAANIAITTTTRTFLRYRSTATGRTYTSFGDNAVATTQSPGNYSTAIATTAYVDDAADEDFIQTLQSIGSNIKAITAGVPFSSFGTGLQLSDGIIYTIPVYMKKPATLTGVRVVMHTAGAFTGDNENRIGLYSENGGTYTLIASSTNNLTLWAAAANALLTIPFTSTVNVTKGKYFVGLMYNSSAETTGPKIIASVDYLNVVWSAVATTAANSNRLYGSKGASVLPTTFAASTLAQPSSNIPLVMVY